MSVTKDTEIWVSQVDHRVSLQVEDARTGRMNDLTVIGKGNRLRLTTQQREMVEEQIRHEHLNPFTNGSLVRLSRPANAVAVEQEMDDEMLSTLLELDGDDFATSVAGLTEINTRRLLALAKETDASHGQVEHLKEHIATQWPIGGDTPTYREIMKIPEGV